ncbi:hypothetical protein TNCV_1581731 [Trichonephila clavipes]|nr:hypothetical protein TNCV_1581731 [Trichonephila clavipes]
METHLHKTCVALGSLVVRVWDSGPEGLGTSFGQEVSNDAISFRKNRGQDYFLTRTTMIFIQEGMILNKRAYWIPKRDV